MRAYDFSPLFRSTVGFDRMSRLLDAAMQQAGDNGQSYPPYNIVAFDENTYGITMAVAGFTEQDIEITQTENSLVVKGKSLREEPENARYLHRGIAARSFEHRFQLADHIKVTGAKLVNGLLDIELVREIPETMRPRTIEIRNGIGAAGEPAKIESREAA